MSVCTDDLCRLCLGTEDLIYIFDDRIVQPFKNMKDVILITTGVEVNESDTISKLACQRCMHITIKMFKFRTTALKNDFELKNKAALLLSEEEIKKEKETEPEPEPEPPEKSTNIISSEPKRPTVHPSVSKLFLQNSLLKLPAACLNNDLAPVVQVDRESTNRLVKKYQEVAARAVTLPKINTINNKENTNKSVNALEISKTPKKLSLSLKKDTPVSKPKDQLPNGPNVEVTTNSTGLKLKFVKRVIPPVECETKHPEKRKRVEQSPDNPTKRPNIVDETSFSSASTSSTEIFVPTPPKDSFKLPTQPINKTPETPLSVVGRTVSVETCKMCNAPVRDMKTHLKKHMKCQFCKQRFKSVQSKEKHVEDSCEILKMMNNLPNVDLCNIMFDNYITSKYADAFRGYEQFKPASKKITTDVVLPNEAPVEKTVITSGTVNLPDDDLPYQIEINNPSTSKDCSTQMLYCDEISLLTDDEDSLPPTILNSETGELTSNKSKQDKTFKKTLETARSARNVIKPDIKIKNDFMGPLDPTASDVKILKDLLYKQSVLHLSSEKEVQTASPVFEDITFNTRDNSYEFANLKSQLEVYKILVNVQNGTYGVSFKEKEKERVKKRVINVWFDKPIDITPAVLTTVPNVPNTPKPPSTATVITSVAGVTQSLQQAAPLRPQQSVSVRPQQPISVGLQQPIYARPLQPNSVGSQQPVSARPRQPFSVGPQQPISAGPQQPISVGPQQPASVRSQQPFSGVLQQPVSARPQHPISVGSQQSVSAGPQQPFSVGPEQPVSVRPQQPVPVQQFVGQAAHRTLNVRAQGLVPIRSYNPTPQWSAHANSMQTNQVLFSIPTQNGQASATVTASLPNTTPPVTTTAGLNHTITPGPMNRPTGATVLRNVRPPHPGRTPVLLRPIRPGSLPAGLNRAVGLGNRPQTNNVRSNPSLTAHDAALRNILTLSSSPAQTNTFNPQQTTSIAMQMPTSSQQIDSQNHAPNPGTTVRVRNFSDLT